GEDPEAMLQESASRKVVLVPIATVGCGKTTLARALVALYSCGHVQNDNINSKRKGAQAFNESVLNVMVHHDLVVADRNNHLARLRDSLTEAISDQYVNCRFVALYWSVDQVDMEKVFRQAVRRIRQRGENHQSLTPNRTQNFEYVIWDFLKNFQPLDTDSSADHLIEDTVVLDPLADTRKNLDTVIDFLVTQLNMRRPSTEEVDQAFAAAMEYKPDVRKNVKSRSQRSSAAYYGLKVDEDLAQVLPAFLRQRLGECQDVSGCRLLEECTKVMEQLQTNGRLPDTYHVTLVHGADTKNSPENTALYNDYEKRWALGDEVPVSISLDYIVWNDELATAHVSSLTADPTSHSYRPASGKPLHLTLGTYSDKVKPYQSNVLLRNIQEQYGSLEEYANCFFEKQQDESPELQSPRLVQLSPPLTLTGYLHKYF
ncbi:trna ligase, partial [Dispira parvispora]